MEEWTAAWQGEAGADLGATDGELKQTQRERERKKKERQKETTGRSWPRLSLNMSITSWTRYACHIGCPVAKDVEFSFSLNLGVIGLLGQLEAGFVLGLPA